MGVDWYACESCGDTFPDCGDYVWCECGRHWCSDKCAESDGHEYQKDEDGDDIDDESTCAYCRGEQFEDSEVLSLALELLGKSWAELTQILKERKK